MNTTANPIVYETYYALIASTGEMREGLPSVSDATRWIAERLGIDRSSLVLENRSSSCGTDLRYEVVTAPGGDVIGTVGNEVEVETPSGLEDRAVERARDAGCSSSPASSVKP